MLNKVYGKLTPLRDHILITEMDFGTTLTAGGIFIPSDDGKSEGIRHRWGRVWAIGPEQTDVKVGEWILVEHGRWTRGVTIVDDTDGEIVIRRVDNKAILMVSSEKPDDRMLRTFGKHSKVEQATFDPGMFMR